MHNNNETCEETVELDGTCWVVGIYCYIGHRRTRKEESGGSKKRR